MADSHSTTQPNTAIRIDPEFEALIRPLSAGERTQLEANLIAHGCRDALVVWQTEGEAVLLDGHNRFALCNAHSIPFTTVAADVNDRNEARIWIIQNQLGRRNLPIFTRGKLVLALKDALAAEAHERKRGGQGGVLLDSNLNQANGRTMETLAKQAGVSVGTLHMIETIVDEAPAPIIEQADADEISVNRAYNVVVALREAQPEVVETVAALGIDDPDSVRLFNEGSKAKRDWWDDIRYTGYIQLGDEQEAVPAKAGHAALKAAIELKRLMASALRRQQKQADMIAEIAALPDEYTPEIIHSDCLDVTWPTGAALVIADPPYGLTVGDTSGVREGKGDWDDLSYDELHTFNEAWIGRAIDALAEDGAILIFGTVHNIFSVGHVLKARGLYIVRDIVWNKPFVQRAVNDQSLVPSHELIIWARKGQRHTTNLTEITRDVWDIQPAAPFGHPTEKPAELIKRLISMTTNADDLVIDPFMGSGVTGAACRELKRRCFGVERDAHWHSIATQRAAG